MIKLKDNGFNRWQTEVHSATFFFSLALWAPAGATMASAVIAIQQRRRRGTTVLEADLQRLDDDVLCPPDERRRSGRMEKMVVASQAQAKPGTDGIAWLPRYAVLSDEKLSFVKAEGEENVIDFIPLAEIEAVSMQQIETEDGQVSSPVRASSKNLLQHPSGRPGSFRALPEAEGETEHHLIIQTIADGFNSGRRYVHRVQSDAAAVCVS